jgi:cell wall-associated NlpC family hydrolase
MVLSYAYCNVSVLPVYKEPFHKAEQVNQLLYGEKAEILEVNDRDWAKICIELDKYEGWCKIGQLATISRREYKKAPKAIAASHTDKLVFENSEQWMPLGSDLFGLKGSKATILGNTGKYKGKKLKIEGLTLNADNVVAAAMQYTNAPYLWGGRTIAGIDCSGLVQMAFKLCGRAIVRDADQQANEGVVVDFLQHAQRGDLAFFDNADGKIVHVGILLDHDTIIHATDAAGRVVIDKIDQGGIISVSLKKRTHNLRFIKRLF